MSAKSSFPYLVDICITSACDRACPWCYMDSKAAGKDAGSLYLSTLARALAEAKVFEVVFGGGEPTLYGAPSDYVLESALRSFSEKLFKVSMTTRNYEWHKSPGFANCVKNIDSLAISCETVEDVKAADALAYAYLTTGGESSWRRRAAVQTILDLHTEESLKALLAQVKEMKGWVRHVVLLGFKKTGRGRTFKIGHRLKQSWMDIAKESELEIGVDSAIVERFGDKLVKYGIAPYRLDSAEGLQTCFVDAVNKVVYPSSTKMDMGGHFMPRPTGEEFLKIFGSF